MTQEELLSDFGINPYEYLWKHDHYNFRIKRSPQGSTTSYFLNDEKEGDLAHFYTVSGGKGKKTVFLKPLITNPFLTQDRDVSEIAINIKYEPNFMRDIRPHIIHFYLPDNARIVSFFKDPARYLVMCGERSYITPLYQKKIMFSRPIDKDFEAFEEKLQ